MIFWKRILTQSSYIFFINIIEKITFFLFFITIARLNSPYDYGNFIIIGGFYTILNPFFDIGIRYYLQREAATENENLKIVVNNFFLFKILGFLLYQLIGIVYLINVVKVNLMIVISYGLLQYLLNFSSSLNQLFYGLNEYKRVFNLFFLIRLFFILFLVINLFGLQNGYIQNLLTFFLVVALLQLTGQFIILKNYNIYFDFNDLSFQKMHALIKNSYMLGISLVIVFIYDKIDIQILNIFISKEEIGFYSIAYSYYKFPQIFSSSVLLPAFSNLSAKFKNAIYDKKEIRNISLFLLLIAMGVIIFYLLFSDYFINFIYGEKYNDASRYLKILSVGIIFYFFNNFTGIILNSMHKEKIAAISITYVMTINITLNFILLAIYKSVYIAIFLSIFSEMFLFLYQFIKLNKEIKKLNYEKA